MTTAVTSRDGATGVRRLDLGLLAALLATLLFAAPSFDPRVVPIHDSLYCLQAFQIFYGHFVFSHDVAQWLPYGTYGISAELPQLIALTPFDYAAAALGALFGARDALLLFKLATLAQHAAYVLGVHLLARALFASRATALALSLAAAGSVIWYAQLWFELRFFYGLPWVLLCFVHFLATERARWLGLAGVASVAWTLGNVPYFVSVWTVVLLLVVAGPSFVRRRAFGAFLRPGAADVAALVAFAACAAAYLYFAFHSLDNLVMREPGRDFATGDVDLQTFLHWGGNADLAHVARALLLGWPLQLPWGSGEDTSAYVGLLTLAGVAVGVVRARREPLFLGLLAATAALVALSLGGRFAELVYHLPTFSHYRHVGHVYGLVKTLAIVASGFGLDVLLRASWAHGRPRRAWWPWLALATGAAAWVAFALAVRSAPDAATGSLAILLRVGCYLAFGAGAALLGRPAAAGLLLAAFVDVATYQLAVARALPTIPVERSAELAAFEVRPLTFQPERLASPADAPPSSERERQQQALDVVRHARSREVYWLTYPFAHFDPCESRFWTDMWTAGVANLLDIASREPLALDVSIGCRSPKLVVVDSVERAHSVGEAAARLIEGVPRYVIRPPRGVEPEGTSPSAPSRPAGTVAVEHFDANELVARVRAEGAGAWLYYADSYHPAWRATIDGRRVPIFEANLAFKALRVPGGESVVHLRFDRPVSGTLGMAIALAGALVGLAVAAVAMLALGGRIGTASARR